jgi:hypothetical protein
LPNFNSGENQKGFLPNFNSRDYESTTQQKTINKEFVPKSGLPFPNYNTKYNLQPQQLPTPSTIQSNSSNINLQTFLKGNQQSNNSNTLMTNNASQQNNLSVSNFQPSPVQPTQAQGLPLNSYVPPSTPQNGFYNPQTSYRVSEFLDGNPNLTMEQKENLTQLSILQRSGFFNPNQTMTQSVPDQVTSYFTINPADLETSLENEVPIAQKIQQQIEFRRSSNQNELTYYAAQIANKNVQSNMLISQVHIAMQNLQQLKANIAELAAQISSARSHSEVSGLQNQMSLLSKNVDQQIGFIRNSLSQTDLNRKSVEQDFSIIRRIVGENSFGNVDHEYASKAAYDAILAHETIKRMANSAESLYLNTQQRNQSFQQGSNSLCFIKTGQQFWKSNPNEILPNLVNLSSPSSKWFNDQRIYLLSNSPV